MRFSKTMAATMLGLLCVAGGSQAFAKTMLKLSHNHNREHAVHKALSQMAKQVQEETKGEVIIRVYPDAQLGSQRESMELMQNGAVDLVKSNATELEAFGSAYSIFGLPYLFRDVDHMLTVAAGEIGQEILASTAPSGFVGLAYYEAGARSFYAKKPIRSPADLKGLKVRVQPSPSAIAMIQALGGNPTPLAWGELYTALQQGVVDIAENNIPSFTLNRHSEVAKFFSLDEHSIVPDVLVISVNTLEKLTPDQRTILKKAAADSTQTMRKLWAESEAQERAKAEKSGVSFITVDKTPFIEAVQPMYDEIARNSPDLISLVERIRAVP